MKRLYTPIWLAAFLFFVCFTHSVTHATTTELKPVAAAVQEKHDLGISFQKFEIFSHARPASGDKILSEIISGTSGELITSKLNGLVQMAPAVMTLNIPFDGKIIPVELVSVNIFAEEFSILSSGDKGAFNYTPGVYYRGIIKGNPNSVASFSLFKNEVYGTISDDVNGNIVIGKVHKPGNTSEYIIYSDKNLRKALPEFCHTGEETNEVVPKYNLPKLSSSGTTNCVRLYYEVDYDIYQYNSNSLLNATNWITAVHNNVATLFFNSTISVTFSQAFIWNTADPYVGLDSDDQLALFHSTRTSFIGDVGQLVTKGDGFSGIADTTNGLCTTKNYSFTDIEFDFLTVPAYSYTIYAVTHEFGHLMGSRHTHHCGWPGGAIDNCGPLSGFPNEGGACVNGPSPAGGGTIMSFCHLVPAGINFNQGFGNHPGTAIRTAVDNAVCLTTACPPCPAPAHNSCSTPSPLSVSSSCSNVYGSLCGATESIPAITCNTRTAASAKDVWYSVVPTQPDLSIKCQSGTGTDVVVVLYSGACGTLTQLSCADATTNGGLETINTTVTPGVTYLIRVYDFNGNSTTGSFGICLTHNCFNVANNECASAIAINMTTACTFINGDLCSATQSMLPEDCSGFSTLDGKDLFYSITPPQDSVIITAQSGPMTDVVLAIYEGTCGALTLLQCTDTVSSGGTENLYLSLTPGVTYYIRIYDWNGNLNGTDFRLCARYVPCTNPAAPVSASATPSLICTGSTTTLTVNGTLTAGAQWKWYSGSCGGTPLGSGSFIVVSPTVSTNYFVRAENGACASICRNTTVNVIPQPTNPVSTSATPTTICSSQSSTLGVTGSLTAGASWQWYTGSCGGTSVGSGASLPVSPTTTTMYYVRAENNICISECDSVEVDVNQTPSDPVSASGTSPICSGTSSTLQVSGTLSGGATWQWYSGSCGGTPVGTGASLNVSPTTMTTYYVRAENGTCFSACESFTVNVNSTPNTATSANASPNSICSAGASSIVSVTGTLSAGATWQWYTGSCGGASAGTGTSITVSPASNTTYFVRAETANCASPCVSTTLSVSTTPNNPVSATGNSPICSGASSTLQVNGTLSAGATWRWYSASCGGTLVGSGASVSVSPTTTTTYFVRAESGACFSTCSSVTITVNQSPAAGTGATATPLSICSVGGSSTLNVTGTLTGGATWTWYSGSCGGTPVGTGSSVNVSPTSTTTYYVRAENGTCSSACVNVQLIVATTPNNPVSATGTSPICSGASTTLQVNGTLSAGASWKWYSGTCGGTSVGTGASVNVSPTTTTTYFVRAEIGACFSTCSSINIMVNPTPTAATAATATPTSICSPGSSTLNATGTLSAGATWQWYSGSCGGTPVGSGASISVSPVANTTYFVRAETANCQSICRNVAVTVTPTPNNPVSISGTSPICSGTNTSLQVNGTLSAGASWKWYEGSCGGVLVGTGASVSVTPLTTTTYYVRAENGSCFSTCSTITINVNPSPSAPDSIIATLTSICSAGGSTTLDVTGSLSAGATWEWYSGTCGGTPVGSGTSITVTPTSTTNYFVRAENANCNSICYSTNIIVASIPNDPDTAFGITPVCAKDSTDLEVTGTLSSGASWFWYEDACGGTPIDTGATIRVAPDTFTTYFVRAEIGGCRSNCISTSIDVLPTPDNPQPINSSATVLCLGDSAILSEIGVPSPGSDWYWYSGSCGGTPISQGTSIVVHPLATETYYVRAEDAVCHSTCESIQIIVNPPPASPSLTLSMDTLYSSSAAAYQWYYSPDSITYTMAGNDHYKKVLIDGYYFVVITDFNGCTSSSDTVLVEDPLSVKETIYDNFLSVYPNPTNDLLNIRLGRSVSSNGMLMIYDATGRLAYTGKIFGDRINTISTSNFAAGVYQLVFSIDEMRFFKKIVKQ